MEPFLIIFVIAFILSCFLTKTGKNIKQTKPESISRLGLINKMNNSKEQNDGFCIENVERPIIPYEKEPGCLYITEHIESVINKQLIL